MSACVQRLATKIEGIKSLIAISAAVRTLLPRPLTGAFLTGLLPPATALPQASLVAKHWPAFDFFLAAASRECAGALAACKPLCTAPCVAVLPGTPVPACLTEQPAVSVGLVATVLCLSPTPRASASLLTLSEPLNRYSKCLLSKPECCLRS